MPNLGAPKLPPIVEFTPDQIGGFPQVFWALHAIEDSAGDRDAVVEAFRTQWFSGSATARADADEQLEQQQKRSGNVISGMRALGLLSSSTKRVTLSELGRDILAAESDEARAARLFAQFLLRERRGIELLEVARSLAHRDGTVSKKAVDIELVARGYNIPTNSGNSGKLRQWLETAGVVDGQWVIDEEVFAELAGVSSDEITDWRKLTSLQQTAVELLRVRAEGSTGPIHSKDFLELLRQRGVEFDGGQVKRDIYRPLFKQGWIEHEVAVGGRGGKGGTIAPTKKTLEVDLDLIEGLMLGYLPPELQSQLSRPISEVLAELKSKNTYTKGIALELLALRLASDCGLMPVNLRVRGTTTGGAELDLVAEAAHLHFSRWLFQCKNTSAPVGLDVLAKELGMATLLRSQVVVIVTTGKFAKSVTDYAQQAAEATSIQVVLIDGALLERYSSQGASALRSELHKRAVAVLSIKRPQLARVPTE